MDEILSIAGDIPVIEDCACAAGASYKNTFAGGLGTLGCFSFHPRKSITTGEGGMITTNDHTISENLNVLRNHGIFIRGGKTCWFKTFFATDFEILGYNYRMTDIHYCRSCSSKKTFTFDR